MLRNSFTKKITKFPEQGSCYKLAFSEINAFIAKADMVIKDLLQMNVRWCLVMAKINRNSQCFLASGMVDMEKQRNFRILLKPNIIDVIHPGFLDDNTEFIQQRTSQWFALRRQSRIMASTMHNALGFCTLKAQKDHYNEFVLGKLPSLGQTPPALLHGTRHEVIYLLISACISFLFLHFASIMNLI